MRSVWHIAACLLLGVPVTLAAGTDGRDPGSIPPIDVAEPPEWQDVEHPTFEKYPVEKGELQNNALFEQFADEDEESVWQRWKLSAALRNGEEEYAGEWAVEAKDDGIFGFANDKALKLKSENQVAAIASKIDPPIPASQDTALPWIVQYEVKLEERLRCGGAYLKLLPPTTDPDWEEFSNATPYLVMFGPDKCGSTDKVHFILRKDGQEHHLVAPPRSRNTLLSTLYTLAVYPDQQFEIRINGEIMRSGNLLDADEFEPPLAPAREIDDPNDEKPSDWDDEELIPDPNETTKPDDWDEEAPALIYDPQSSKPENWHEDWPLYIPDPEAVKPAGWDDEEDGDWTAPEILNPQCIGLDAEAGEGCGEWIAPLIRNPNYRGKWSQPQIINPNYKGVWEPRKIPNPEFDAEQRPSLLDQDIGGVGFELLTVQGNIMFDNIYIGQSLRDAENIGNATWSPKYFIEHSAEERALQAYRDRLLKDEKSAHPSTSGDFSGIVGQYRRELADFKLDPYNYATTTYRQFIDAFRANKLAALKQFPLTAAVATALGCVISAIAFGIINVVLILLTGHTLDRPPKTEQATPRVKVTPEVKVTDVDDKVIDVDDEVIRSVGGDKK